MKALLLRRLDRYQSYSSLRLILVFYSLYMDTLFMTADEVAKEMNVVLFTMKGFYRYINEIRRK